MKIFTKSGIVFLGLYLVSCSILTPTSKRLFNKSINKVSKYDAIIVPGIPFYEPKWDKVMLMRVTWAVYLYNTGKTENIIMSGGSIYSPYVEAEIMKLYAIKLGVPEDKIFVEKAAEHSTENVWNSFKMGNKLGFTKIALATDPFQTKMLYRFCKRRIHEIGFLPVIFDTLKTLPHETPEIDYSNYKVENFVSLPERQNWWKRFRGTRGKNIDFTKNK